MVEQQGRCIDEVFHVDLKDLQLAEQQVRRGQGRPIVSQAVGQFDDVTHLHPVDEDVDLAPVHPVEVEQALISIEGIEAAVALVAERLEALLDRLPLFGGGDEIEIAVFALQRRLPGTRAVEVDRRAAHQLDPDPGLGGGGRDPLRLGDDIRDGDRLRGQLTAPGRPR